MYRFESYATTAVRSLIAWPVVNTLTVARGKQVAELRPLRSTAVPIAELMHRRAHLPLVDPDELRRDLDSVIDASL